MALFFLVLPIWDLADIRKLYVRNVQGYVMPARDTGIEEQWGRSSVRVMCLLSALFMYVLRSLVGEPDTSSRKLNRKDYKPWSKPDDETIRKWGVSQRVPEWR
ncbi:hypothetical protein MBLNU457_g0325t1 [Dothideomycetes sp. NU457]